MKLNFLRKLSDILFVFLLLAIGFHYNYHEIIVKPPVSVHMWRQADCASIAYNYYQNDMNFFRPEMHNLMSDNFTSGCNIGECPLIHYFVAVLYKIFGFNDFWYRLVVLLLFYIGLFALYKTFELIIISRFWSFCLSLLFFASPNLVYYGNNFLSDSPAFSISLLGLYFFFKYYYKKDNRFFILSIIMFTLASLMKITAGMSLVVIIIIFILERFKNFKFLGNQKVFNLNILHIITICCSTVIIIAWYFFARNYNVLHNNTGYFLTGIWPIWVMTKAEIQLVIDMVLNIWHKIYFDISVLYFLLISFIFCIFYMKKANRLLFFFLITIFFGVVSFILLFFFVFSHHDYYLINLYVLPVFILLAFFDIIRRNFGYLMDSKIIRTFFLIFLFYNIQYTKGIINERYREIPLWDPYFNEIQSAKSYIKSIGISKDDKVIVLDDFTPNYILYAINSKGWSKFNPGKFDTTSINKFIRKGANYFLSYNNEIDDSIIANNYLTNKIGIYNNVHIFRVDNSDDFKYPLGYSDVICCDMETVKDNDFFDKSGIILNGGLLQSSENSFSGNSSLLLDGKDNQYGLTYMLDVKPLETFYTSIWCYSLNGKGSLVVNDTTGKLFRKEVNKYYSKTANGWGLLEMSFTIPEGFKSEKVGIYVYNPSGVNVFFDDYVIKKTNY